MDGTPDSVEFAVTTRSAAGEDVDPFSAFTEVALQAAVSAALAATSGAALQEIRSSVRPAVLVRAAAASVASLQEVRSAVLSGDFAQKLTHALAAGPRKDSMELAPGAQVRMDGLQQRPALNGKHAVLLSYDAAAGRWDVDVGGKQQLRLRPANLYPPDIVATADATQFAEELERQVLSLLTLTAHQQEKLGECLIDEDVHLRAPAGSGKTFVALHRLLSFRRGPGGSQDGGAAAEGGDMVLYVARNKSLALFAVSWLVKRTPHPERRRLLGALHVLYEPFDQGPQRVQLRKNVIVPVPLQRGGGDDGCSYALVVVDEAHHVYSSPQARETVEGFVGAHSRRMLLSDVSQSLGCNVRYPAPMRDVLLSEV